MECKCDRDNAEDAVAGEQDVQKVIGCEQHLHYKKKVPVSAAWKCGNQSRDYNIQSAQLNTAGKYFFQFSFTVLKVFWNSAC